MQKNPEIEFGPQQMRSLKLIDSDGLYTNLALLLSDQCVHSIKDLANIFYRLQLIEAYGTGISKIMKAYEELKQPKTPSKSYFQMSIPILAPQLLPFLQKKRPLSLS